MIPKSLEAFLKKVLPERTWQNRLVCEAGLCYMEFSAVDIERLSRLGITVDSLGPKLVACLWDSDSSLEVGGYLVVDNLAMGRPAMGGIRMLPDLTPAEIFYRARGMTLKNAAANLPFGGGKAGVLADPHLDIETRREVIRRFARLLVRYRDIFLPGPDVGTHTEDMKQVALQNGLDLALSKPEAMGGNRLDELGAAGGGLVIALEALLQELPRLRSLPQFNELRLPEPDQMTVIIQGFGSVGANAAYQLKHRLPYARITGISDTSGYLYDEMGLPVEKLYDFWKSKKQISHHYFMDNLTPGIYRRPKYGSCGNDLLRESAFCMIPAAPVANYLDTEESTHPSITVKDMGTWSIIIEGANTYSPEPANKTARQRMERAVYRDRGVMIATDFLVNSGSVIYAAQEHLIKTPPDLEIPEEFLGNQEFVDQWLVDHETEFHQLASLRRVAAQQARDEIIQRNMRELVELLVSDPDMLPCEAAEQLSIRRIAASERQRTAVDVMFPAIIIKASCSIRDAAIDLIDSGSSLLVIVDQNDHLVGVVTQWDITRATADGLDLEYPIEKIMSREVISVTLDESLINVVRKLEYHEISVIPVVQDKQVLGLISTDHLARRSLLPLLVQQTN